MAAGLTMAGCGGSASTTTQTTTGGGEATVGTYEQGSTAGAEMGDEELQYVPSRVYWTNKGSKLVVEGGICNSSDAFDVVQIDEAVVYVVDGDGNVVAEAKVNVGHVGAVPHNGSVPYNFTVTSIPGGSGSYGADELYPVLAARFTYGEHGGQDCPYCGGGTGATYPDDDGTDETYPDGSDGTGGGGTVMPAERDCTKCFGSGKCQLCAGRGDSACPGCNNGRCTTCDHGYYRRGDTRTECIVCHGDGLCDICGGSGRRDCGLCKTTGKCTRCGGTGKLA